LSEARRGAALLGAILMLVCSAPGAQAAGSRDLWPSGAAGSRANSEWRDGTVTYGGGLLVRRTLLKAYMQAGEVLLLGSSAVDITPATTGTPIPEYGYVPQGRAKGQFADIAEGASGTIDEVTGLVRDLRAGKGSAGKLNLSAQLEIRPGVKKPIAWCCEQPTNPDGSITIELKDSNDRGWRKGV